MNIYLPVKSDVLAVKREQGKVHKKASIFIIDAVVGYQIFRCLLVATKEGSMQG